MSEGAPDYCPKCQEGINKLTPEQIRELKDANENCEACKGTGSIRHGDTHDSFDAECHFCGGTGQKSETLLCWVCDSEMTRREGKVICISCDMEYRRLKSELVVCDDLKNEWFKSSEFYEEQRDRYRTALESIVEARVRIRGDATEAAR
jgi:RecJ-like exonuclease